MQTISYRGIEFDWVQTLSQTWMPVMSDDGVDYLCSRLDLVVRVLMAPLANSFTRSATGTIGRGGQSLATASEAAIRHILAQPRGTLIVTTYDGVEVIHSPQVVSGTELPSDVRGGPFCEVLGSPVMHSDRTWEWTLHFVTYMRECSQTMPQLFLSHRITQSAQVNDLSFTDIITEGKAVVNLGVLFSNMAISSIDFYRDQLFIPVPQGFRRSVIVTLSSDGSQLQYTITDSQYAIGYNGTIAQKIEITQSVRLHSPGLGLPISSIPAVPVPSNDHGDPHMRRRIDTASRANRFIGIANASIALGASLIPQKHNSVVVQCWGTPTSNRNRLTALALALARNKIDPAPARLSATITLDMEVTEDVMGKYSSVAMTAGSGLGNALINAFGVLGSNVAQGAIKPVVDFYFPPSLFSLQNIMINSTLSPLTASESVVLPAGITANLDDPLIAPGKDQPPPASDSVSRGTWLLKLVYSVLLGPCESPPVGDPEEADDGETLP